MLWVLPRLLDWLGPHAFPGAGPPQLNRLPGSEEISAVGANGCGFPVSVEKPLEELSPPASACHPGHLGQSVGLRQTRPFWKKGVPARVGTCCGSPPPRAVTLVLLRLHWDREARCPCWQAPRAALSDSAAQPVGSSVPSLGIRSSEAPELRVFQVIKTIQRLQSL